eukprot:jgi/Mesvir1/576/Mv02022-RA.1
MASNWVIVLSSLLALGALARSDACEFRCPTDYIKVPDPKFKGAGTKVCSTASTNVGIQGMMEFDRCCVKRDDCMMTCGNKFNDCMVEFDTCLKGMCDEEFASKKDLCMDVAKIFTESFYKECDYYLGFQQRGCRCLSRREEL